jgi:dihydroorotate dehydrogenase (NAD+) catalytic subunit
MQREVDLRGFAAFVTKSVTLHPRPGHPYPQIVRTPSGWLNSLGLPNHGLAGFLTKDLPFLKTLAIPIIVSIAGDTVQEFVTLAEWLSQEDGVAAIELNVSCPNVERGLVFGVDPQLTRDLVTAVRAVCPRPLFVKLTPNVTDIVSIARAAQEAGADAVSLINTLAGLAIDVHTRKPRLGATIGGLSGPAIKPVAVRMVWEVARHCSIPIIGMGGIETAEDALEFHIAGAQAVAVGSGVIDRPGIASEICAGLVRYLQEHELLEITPLVGSLHREE